MTIKEHDMVVLSEDVENIPKGSKGCVVHIYPQNKAYVVEFNVGDETILKTVPISKIQLNTNTMNILNISDRLGTILQDFEMSEQAKGKIAELLDDINKVTPFVESSHFSLQLACENSLFEAYLEARKKLPKAINSGAVDHSEWPKENPNILLNIITIAILENQAQQYKGKGTSFEKEVLKSVDNLKLFL